VRGTADQDDQTLQTFRPAHRGYHSRLGAVWVTVVMGVFLPLRHLLRFLRSIGFQTWSGSVNRLAIVSGLLRTRRFSLDPQPSYRSCGYG